MQLKIGIMIPKSRSNQISSTYLFLIFFLFFSIVINTLKFPAYIVRPNKLELGYEPLKYKTNGNYLHRKDEERQILYNVLDSTNNFNEITATRSSIKRSPQKDFLPTEEEKIAISHMVKEIENGVNVGTTNTNNQDTRKLELYKYLTPTTLLRFYRGHKKNMEKAVEKTIAYYQWRQESKADQLAEESYLGKYPNHFVFTPNHVHS